MIQRVLLGKRIRLPSDASVFITTIVRIRNRSNVHRCDPEISVDCMEEDAIQLRILHFVRTTILHQIPLKISITIGVSLIFRTTLSRRELISRTISRTSSKDIFRGYVFSLCTHSNTTHTPIFIRMRVGTENISLYPRNGLEMEERLSSDSKERFITPPCF